MKRHSNGSRRRPLGGGSSLLALLALGPAGCTGIFDVENPNNVNADDLEVPSAAAALVNGTLSSVAQSWSRMLALTSTATDEVRWIGSRQGWLKLDQGTISDPLNEFVDAAWISFGQARWLADETITKLEGFQSAGELLEATDLARAYLYGGIVYTLIGDSWDDFVLSDRSEAAAPVGPDNMSRMYTTAVEYLTNGLAIARSEGADDLELRLLAQRARARFAAAVWQKLNPPGMAPSDPWVNDSGANSDAADVLARVGNSDWKYEFAYSATTVTSYVGGQINNRQELRFDDDLATYPGRGSSKPVDVVFNDIIDDKPDPVLSELIFNWTETRDVGSLTVVSAREMHLILAEAALVSGDETSAVTHINHVRAMTPGLTPFDPGMYPASTAEVLRHTRFVNLFFQGRRLGDLYRYGDPANLWQTTSEAYNTPGVFFPITQIERESNPNVG